MTDITRRYDEARHVLTFGDRLRAMRMSDAAANVEPGYKRAFRNLKLTTSTSHAAIGAAIRK